MDMKIEKAKRVKLDNKISTAFLNIQKLKKV